MEIFLKVTKYCSNIHTYIHYMEGTCAIFICTWVNINVNAYGHSCYQFIKSELERFYDCDYVTITENILLLALWHEWQHFLCACIFFFFKTTYINIRIFIIPCVSFLRAQYCHWNQIKQVHLHQIGQQAD